jgi:DNA-binding MarR family transcriptional regulator/GNAT superfamily N-acetyltransferase
MSPRQKTIDAIRAFSRFYTTRLGVVGPTYLKTHYTLSDARVIFEINAHPKTRATELVHDLGIDPAYLSRIVARFRKEGLLTAETNPQDGRSRTLALTAKGTAEAARLAELSRREVGSMIERLSDAEARTLEAALQTAERYLSGGAGRPEVILREHRPGDMGWIVESQAAFYQGELGWNSRFEALVAGVVSDFLTQFKPQRERVWIAERDGARVGSIVLADGGDNIAKLRLLYVDTAARGFGLGRRMVDECVAFARNTGYEKISLWTNQPLLAARSIYASKGFKLVAEEEHDTFGALMVGETWELDLSGSIAPSA